MEARVVILPIDLTDAFQAWVEKQGLELQETADGYLVVVAAESEEVV